MPETKKLKSEKNSSPINSRTHHVCEGCNSAFPIKDAFGKKRPQHNFIAPAYQVRIGRRFFQVPRLCHSCLEKIESKFEFILSGISDEKQ